jgi:hypothetical protein
MKILWREKLLNDCTVRRFRGARRSTPLWPGARFNCKIFIFQQVVIISARGLQAETEKSCARFVSKHKPAGAVADLTKRPREILISS